MGENYALVPGLEAQASEDQATAIGHAIALELLIVEVERGRFIAHKRAVLTPAK